MKAFPSDSVQLDSALHRASTARDSACLSTQLFVEFLPEFTDFQLINLDISLKTLL